MKFLKSFIILACMIGATGAATALRPTKLMSELDPHQPIEMIIPVQFAGWEIDPNVTPLAVDPTLEKTLSEIYSQTLSRTYINRSGQRVMLSIAYGANQSRDLQLHRPEVCYSAQGFQVKQTEESGFALKDRTIHSKSLIAKQGGRLEPIDYWMRVGDRVVTTGLEQMLTRYEYGLQGYIPDGLLFRISSIGGDVPAARELHRKFVSDLYSVVNDKNRTFLFGKLTEDSRSTPASKI